MKSILFDLGGTHCRLAFVTGGKINDVSVVNSPTNAESLLLEIENYAKKHEEAESLFASIAGPIETVQNDQIVKLTNLGFSISKSALEKVTDLKVEIVNDLHALAMAIPKLESKNIECVIPFQNHKVKDGKIGIISCGTGLGVAFENGGHTSFPSEGGHIEFAPTNEVEWELFQFMKKHFSHVSYERVLSGSSQKIFEEFFTSRRDLDSDLFWWQILARFTASIALVNLCYGGIYLAGGYLRSKSSSIQKYKDAFTSSFFDKGRLTHALNMGIFLIHHETPELLGLLSLSNKK